MYCFGETLIDSQDNLKIFLPVFRNEYREFFIAKREWIKSRFTIRLCGQLEMFLNKNRQHLYCSSLSSVIVQWMLAMAGIVTGERGIKQISSSCPPGPHSLVSHTCQQIIAIGVICAEGGTRGWQFCWGNAVQSRKETSKLVLETYGIS